jgi:hypothetical protein
MSSFIEHFPAACIKPRNTAGASVKRLRERRMDRLPSPAGGPENTYIIEFRGEGYEPVTRKLTNHIGIGWVILDVVTGLVPVLIDALTGSWYEFDQVYLNVILERQRNLSSVLFPEPFPPV